MLRSELMLQVSKDIRDLKESLANSKNPIEIKELQYGIMELEEYHAELRREEESEVH